MTQFRTLVYPLIQELQQQFETNIESSAYSVDSEILDTVLDELAASFSKAGRNVDPVRRQELEENATDA